MTKTIETHPADAGVAVSIMGLRKSYGTKTAVDGVSIAVGKGEVFGLIGANGA